MTLGGRQAARFALWTGLAALGAGCSVQDTFVDGRLASRSFGLGPLAEAPCAGEGERHVSTTLGVAVGAEEAVVGFRKIDRVCLPLKACGAVLFVEAADEISVVRNLLPDWAGVCVVADEFAETKQGKGST